MNDLSGNLKAEISAITEMLVKEQCFVPVRVQFERPARRKECEIDIEWRYDPTNGWGIFNTLRDVRRFDDEILVAAAESVPLLVEAARAAKISSERLEAAAEKLKALRVKAPAAA